MINVLGGGPAILAQSESKVDDILNEAPKPDSDPDSDDSDTESSTYSPTPPPSPISSVDVAHIVANANIQEPAIIEITENSSEPEPRSNERSESNSHRLRPIQRNHLPPPLMGTQLAWLEDVDGIQSYWNQRIVQIRVLSQENTTNAHHAQFNSLRSAIMKIFDHYSNDDTI